METLSLVLAIVNTLLEADVWSMSARSAMRNPMWVINMWISYWPVTFPIFMLTILAGNYRLSTAGTAVLYVAMYLLLLAALTIFIRRAGSGIIGAFGISIQGLIYTAVPYCIGRLLPRFMPRLRLTMS